MDPASNEKEGSDSEGPPPLAFIALETAAGAADPGSLWKTCQRITKLSGLGHFITQT